MAKNKGKKTEKELLLPCILSFSPLLFYKKEYLIRPDHQTV